MSFNETKNQNRLALRHAVLAGADFGYELNALTLLKNQLDLATAGTLGARASSRIFVAAPATALAASPFREHTDFLHGILSSGFRIAKVAKADLDLVAKLAKDPESLERLINNLIKIISDEKVGLAFRYSLYMSAVIALTSAVLRYADTPNDEQNVARAKKLMRVMRTVLLMFATNDIHEKLDKFKNSPAHAAILKAWSLIKRFCKRMWEFVKAFFRSLRTGTDGFSAPIDVKKLLGTCVSMAGLVQDTAKRTGVLKVDDKRLAGLPLIHTSINAPVEPDGER